MMKLTSIKLVVICFTVLALLIGVIGCTPKEVPVKTLKVGLLSYFTGILGTIGIRFGAGLEIGCDDINAAGGVDIGGEKYFLKVFRGDCGTDPGLARALAEKLIYDEKVNVLVVTGDPLDWPSDPVTTREKVMMLTNSCNTYLFEAPDHPYTFGAFASPLEMSATYYPLIRELYPDVKTVYRIGWNFAFDRINNDAEREVAEQYGFEWLGEVFYEPGITDFAPVVAGVMAAKPDLITLGMIIEDTIPVIRTIREQGYEGQVHQCYIVWQLKDVLKGLEGIEYMAEGFITGQYALSPPTPEMEILGEKYKAKTGAESSGAEVNAYPYALWIAEAFHNAGTIEDPEAIRLAFENAEVVNPLWPGHPVMTTGGLERYGQRHVLQVLQSFAQVQDGKPVTIRIAPNICP